MWHKPSIRFNFGRQGDHKAWVDNLNFLEDLFLFIDLRDIILGRDELHDTIQEKSRQYLFMIEDDIIFSFED